MNRSHGVRTRMERDTILYGQRVAKALRAENKYHRGGGNGGMRGAINAVRCRAIDAYRTALSVDPDQQGA